MPYKNIPKNYIMKILLKNAIIALLLMWNLAAPQSAMAADTSLKDAVTEGKFGTALNAAWGAADAAQALPAYKTFPLTVELWCKLGSNLVWNDQVLVAAGPRESADHWEVYLEQASGTPNADTYGMLGARLPGMVPEVIKSPKSIADGQWHYVAMVVDGQSVALYVDGGEVVKTAVTRKPGGTVVPGTLSVAKAVLAGGGTLDFDGAIDDVRLSNTVRVIHGIPTAPLKADAQTIGLWSFDQAGGTGEFADASANANPMQVSTESMDALDLTSFKPGPSPMSSEPDVVELKPGIAEHPAGPTVLSLDGAWQMAEGGEPAARLSGEWADAISAEVPGSVHTALQKAGKIPDPKVGLNDAWARDKSFKTWWFKRTFKRPQNTTGERLTFGGVAIKATVWLNGKELGTHEGMFGGPDFEIAGLLKDENTLIVKISPAPYVEGKGQPNDFFKGMNVGWLYTVVFNNVYGWHYSNIPALGIWRSVRIEGAPTVRLDHPFVATRDAQAGIVDLSTVLEGGDKPWSGRIVGTIEPDNFQGQPYNFSLAVRSAGARKPLHLRFTVPDPKLWWPNDLGEHNLYRLKLSFLTDGGAADYRQVCFGIRTIEMAPLPGGPSPRKYNWTFVVNKRPIFVKGTGWCTMDSSMDFSPARYERLVKLAAMQHVQMVRAWGSGMPETDEFYDLCNRYGIMVIQEWPTAWDSHREGWQPYDLLEETVRRNTLRLRNNPALVMWGGGNESDAPFGKAIDMMGRYAVELDGTRPFHRGEPWGGSRHDYGCDWGRMPLDYALSLKAPFFGEFGMRSMPVYESVQRYLPDDEKHLWPAPDGKSLAYHTPVFNKMEDMARLRQFSSYFTAGKTMQEFIVGSQLAATTCVRHMLEQARTRWPDCSGSLYYKMNDNYPAASWACVDWYGAPKINHYFFAQAFAPLHACVLFDSFSIVGKSAALPVFLLDDADALKDSGPWEAVVRAYDAKLGEIKRESYQGTGAINRVAKLGEFTLSAEQTASTPLLMVVEVKQGGRLVDRTFYWMNFLAAQDCLFRLPRSQLAMRVADGKVIVTNTGKLPAVGVNVSRPGHLDTFTTGENYFWLEPGEVKTVSVSATEGLQVGAFNNAPQALNAFLPYALGVLLCSDAFAGCLCRPAR